jgi:hypothetical protein
MHLLTAAFGTKRTSHGTQPMSAFGGKADIDWTCFDVRFRPKADMGGSGLWPLNPIPPVL